MDKRIYFDTELTYRNTQHHLNEYINNIRPGANGDIAGFTEFSSINREKIEKIYNPWEDSFLFVNKIIDKYNWDYFELKFLELGKTTETITIDIDGCMFFVNNLDFSMLRTDMLNALELKLLMKHVSKLYKSILCMRKNNPSLIVGGNDGKHNNCLCFYL